MEPLDDFDPQGQQHDANRAIMALLVIMGLVLIWGTVIAPMISPPPKAEKAPAEKVTTAQPTTKDTTPSKPPRLTTGVPTKATTSTPTKGTEEPGPPTPPGPEPPEPGPEIAPAEVTLRSPLLAATFTNQDARLARLVLLDHYRTPMTKRRALRARRHDPAADVSPYGLPLLGQEEAAALVNGGFEEGDGPASGEGQARAPRKWVPSPSEDLETILLWTRDAWAGSRAVAIKSPAKEAHWRTTVRDIVAGATHEVSCWAKVEAEGALPADRRPALVVVQQDQDGKEVPCQDEEGRPRSTRIEVPLEPTGQWARFDARFIAEPWARQVQVLLRAPEGFKGQVAFDEVALLRFGGASLVLLPRPEPGASPSAEAPSLFGPRRFGLVAAKDNQVAFRAVYPAAKLEVTKTFVLPKPEEPEQRHVRLEVQFRNLGDQPLNVPGYLLRGPAGLAADLSPPSWKHGETVPNELERKAAANSFAAAVARQATGGQINVPKKSCAEIHTLEAGSDKEKATTFDEVGGVLWAAVASNYFVSILEPRPEESRRMTIESGGARSAGPDNVSAVVQVAPFALEPSGTAEDHVVHCYRLYAGPKSPALLASYDAKYERLIASRWLDPLTAACGWVLRASYWLVPNYGIAIIVLTILVRVALHPLSKKSQTSMQKMQKLQPQVAEIRERFKADKKRQQEEMMKLYKTYGVNPMGGCLPILLQIPIFIGLWRALQESIELRQAAFAFWIQDLSQPDALFGAVNVLPIASCVMMFLQQKLAPKAGDAQQQQTQKMMGYIMPVFLGWILYGLPSGLALYFIASTLIGLGEQRVIKMHMDKMGELKPVAERPSKQTRKAVFTKGQKRPKRKLF